MKADPMYAIGYEHGLDGKINDAVDSEAYFAGQKAGAEARAMLSAAGFKPQGDGVFKAEMKVDRDRHRRPVAFGDMKPNDL